MGPFRFLGRSANWMPLSVRTVRIGYCTAATSRSRNAIASTVVAPLGEPRKGELRGPVDGDEQAELAFFGAHFADVDVEEADRAGLERLARGPSAFEVRQAADAVALETAMQRRPRQVRDPRLKGIEAIIESQQGLPSEGDDGGLLCLARRNRTCRLGAMAASSLLRLRHFATVLRSRP